MALAWKSTLSRTEGLVLQSYHFVIANVFAQTHFGGNQLAVFTDAAGLSDETMQAIARQMNFSETTFVLPPRDMANAANVRIFTPASELPFAGHPTVGTAAVLGYRGLGSGRIVLEEGIGNIEVDVMLRQESIVARFTVRREIEIPAIVPSFDLVASLLTLNEADVVSAWFASGGVPFLVAHLASRETVDHAMLDRTVWAARQADLWSPHVLIFSGEVGSEPLYARMFAPALGVDEDPATGAAAVTLVGSLAKRARKQTLSITIDQGVKMGRPSVIEASADMRDGLIASIEVGGSTVILGEGTLRVPSSA
ncbi:PhzF family phenazine biosynthesis protein [Mesorhizobium sp. B2-3-4]|uniref:PhzF family phenazine biosynthesis protein n=1 Tax=Mesorhizobium sp. B2-3-4 TaxID=2589959 RepID=UPI0015E45720|nr:PhzF family phenazine biosynthesis protein [Mesorhizobium sp. B2-3-4]